MNENLPKIDPLPTAPKFEKDTNPEKVDALESDQRDALVPTVLTVAPTLEVSTVPSEPTGPIEPIEPVGSVESDESVESVLIPTATM
jgi:hypothetical protein